jgi:hypothetical protein
MDSTLSVMVHEANQRHLREAIAANKIFDFMMTVKYHKNMNIVWNAGYDYDELQKPFDMKSEDWLMLAKYADENKREVWLAMAWLIKHA